MKRCQRCKKLFVSEAELDGHVQHEKCEWKGKRHMTSATAMIELFKGSSSDLPEESLWVNMFKVLLPEVPDHEIPSPCK
jgi:hypothetical protein